jgi:hypothetical protein
MYIPENGTAQEISFERTDRDLSIDQGVAQLRLKDIPYLIPAKLCIRSTENHTENRQYDHPKQTDPPLATTLFCWSLVIIGRYLGLLSGQNT